MQFNRLKYLGLILCFVSWTKLNAQNTFGALNSNFTPTSSVHINPSSMLDAKTWLDINIVGIGSYTNNNLFALENTTVIRSISSGLPALEDLHINSGSNFYHVYNRNYIQLLGAVLSQGDHAFGLSLGGYSYTTVRGIDDSLAYLMESGINGTTIDPITQHSLRNFNVTGLAHGEIKLSYGYTFLKQRNEMFMLGLSIKKIFPLAGAALKMHQLDYNVVNEILNMNNFQGDVMLNTSPEFSFKGGTGLDLGFTYQKMYDQCRSYYPNSKKNGCSRKLYRYKIGVSINDIGYAKFNPDNTEYYGYQESDTQYDLNRGINSADDILNQLTGDLENGIVKNPNKMSLPTTFSVQVDYNILPGFLYVNGTWVQGIGPRKKAFGPRHANSISVTPRFETKWVDFALPFSLYEYQKAQLGASIRLYILTIGTDKLLNYFVPSNVYGSDIYMALKVPIFYNPKCKGKEKGGGMSLFGGKHKKRVAPCDAYR